MPNAPLLSATMCLTAVFEMGTGGPHMQHHRKNIIQNSNIYKYIKPIQLNNNLITGDTPQKYTKPDIMLSNHKVRSIRTISNGKLNTSLHLHFHPINPVVYWGP